jgi:succinoglycan biosynthesis transport protein ExoP
MVQKMRSEVMWPLDPGVHRTVVVTSAHEEEGKTTVTANLAVAIAKQGHDVVVVDADLRRPLLHSYLGVPVGPSTVDLEAVLRGGATVQRALLEISLLTPAEGGEERGLRPVRQVAKKSSTGSRRPPGRLRALLAAPGKPASMEFQLEMASDLMEKLHQQANIVIVDTPPILTVTDAYAMVAVADTVVATIRNGRSTASATTALYRTLTRLRSKRADSLKLLVTEIEPQFDVAYGYFSPPSSGPTATSQAPSGLVRVENLPPSPPAGS